MELLSTIEESLPGILLCLPETLLNEDPKGDRDRYRPFYKDLIKMKGNIDLVRLKEIKEELLNNEASFTQHDTSIKNIQDWWFGTRRVYGDTFLIVLYGLVSAYINALTDLASQDHHLDEDKVDVIYAGLYQMAETSYEFLYQEPSDLLPENYFSKNSSTTRNKAENSKTILHPMHRWRAGHQLFFTSIQTLNILFTMIRKTVDNKEWGLANKYIRKSAFFMGMSARSIEYASNYDRDQYHSQVRSLMPQGFSGLMLADHTLLINLLKKLKEKVFSNPPEQIRESVAMYLEAMEECYDAHNLICESFVNTGASLRDLQIAKDNPPPAIEVLDKFKERRKKMLSRNAQQEMD